MGVRMSTPRLPHLHLFLEGLHEFIPGLIHAFKEDGGAKSIAGFTNYEKAKPEILWAVRIIGVHGISSGLAQLSLIYLSVASKDPLFYSSVLRFYTLFDIVHSVIMILVMKFSGNGTHTVAPKAPGNWTPLIRFALVTTSLILL